jgi:hypothetical protein
VRLAGAGMICHGAFNSAVTCLHTDSRRGWNPVKAVRVACAA